VCSKKIDLLKAVNDVIALERPTIIVKKLKLDFDYQPDVPQIILSDEHRITRILLNLLSNAVKFTKQGSIKVGLGVAKKIDDNHVVLKLTVEDTGMGIPEKLQATMYDRFVRGTPANQGIYQGTGLGLSIVKEFLEELGGKISVESKVDQGTTFTCLIPVELPEAKKSHFKILLIEKESTIIPIELHLLRSNLPEAQIELVKTEEDAIKLIMQNNYDLIFMGMDWYPHDSCRITRSIREITQLPIVTLTAHPLEEVEAVFRASGADEVLLFTDINKNISTIARELINKS
jgi:CheY-like chemotaxis protein